MDIDWFAFTFVMFALHIGNVLIEDFSRASYTETFAKDETPEVLIKIMGKTVKPNTIVLAGLIFIRAVQVALISQFRDQSRKLKEYSGNIWIGLLFMYLVLTIFTMMYKQ